ncbi:hypothetical protein [Methylobacterium nodulans]|uniref:Uncharacterized protein n=1 Tax=Methylobacterium nodulans (strain LMG 21967 / CNCM I-2342 / ORS 2060) TaxID=460265 RepID=B8IIQ7_METNO|nr:hypothetical protein [Methylobacterium nodulans]ACL59934.1 conserved hypothetical protein [Methylobacterium nodulans ORS 2060]
MLTRPQPDLIASAPRPAAPHFPAETFPAFEPPLFLREPLTDDEPQREPANRDWLATGLVIVAVAILIALALSGGALVNAVRGVVL